MPAKIESIVEPTNPFEGYTSAQYDETDNWLCRPDIEGDENVCNRDLSATIVFPDGSTQLEPFVEVEDQSLDCFYVYPTLFGEITTLPEKPICPKDYD